VKPDCALRTTERSYAAVLALDTRLDMSYWKLCIAPNVQSDLRDARRLGSEVIEVDLNIRAVLRLPKIICNSNCVLLRDLRDVVDRAVQRADTLEGSEAGIADGAQVAWGRRWVLQECKPMNVDS